MLCKFCGAVLEGAIECRNCGKPTPPANLPLAPTLGVPEKSGTQIQRAVNGLQRFWRSGKTLFMLASATPEQRTWDLVSILGGGVLGGYWLIASQIVGSPGGWQTALVMTAVPWVLCSLRRPIDRLLAPLQSIRSLAPPWMLLVLGVLAPFGLVALVLQWVASFLHLGDQRAVQLAVVLGGFLAHAILRQPEAGAGGGASRESRSQAA